MPIDDDISLDGTIAMDTAKTWHDAAVRDLHDLLVADPAIETLALVGSGARGQLDAWSDLDVLIVVRPAAFVRFFPALDWLAPLGRIYAFEQHHHEEDRGVSRVCFDELRRIDVIVTTEAALIRPDAASALPLGDGARVLFSRRPAVDAVLAQDHASPVPHVSDDAFDSLANGFWFKATVAVQKVVRGDLLVAFHLSLELVQECCVLAMMLRDRETGRTVHRDGVGNEAVTALAAISRPNTPDGMLDTIEESVVAFDRLAARWSVTYLDRRHPLRAWVSAARRDLAGEAGRESEPPVWL